MRSQIWRQPLQAGRDFFLSIPVGAKHMAVVAKGNEPQLYFFVPDIEAEKIDRLFFVVPTGVDLRPEEIRADYLGSFTVVEGGALMVFHVLSEALRE